MEELKFHPTDHLIPLIGSKVVWVIVDDSDNGFGEEVFFGLRLKTPTNKIYDLWLLSDEEGNRPGAFQLSQVTDKKILKENGIIVEEDPKPDQG